MIKLLSGTAALIEDAGRGTVNMLRWMRDVSNDLNAQTEGTATPTDVVNSVPGPSPFAFTAPSAGNLYASGGTVSSVTLTRGTFTFSVPNSFIPVSAGDIVTYTYTAAPTLRFIPR